MAKLSGMLLALALLGGRGAFALPVPESDEAESAHHAVNPALFPKDSHPFGTSIEGWAENWWRWLLSIPAAENPILTLAADCSVNQDGPVFYIPSSVVGAQGVIRTCTVPQGKALAMSLSTVLNDFPCPDPSFKPAPGQSLFDFLLAGAVEANGDIVTIEVSLDGVLLNDLLDYHYASRQLMLFQGDLSLQPTLDSCITGAPQPAAVDAYFIVVKPLPPGRHEITRRIVNAKGVVSGPNTVIVDVTSR